ncbi:MAG TPA: outer membrane beta-barrel protein [Bradyrhizobium sp.]|uniref:outer membrane protein n=1 Tax=Bradyrhizobium sp. TaxID=376 RepID=UPI002B9A21D8|nr:outer membrane beta-barrel protein [Bradyrhizobium sp.]HLZ05966.1 outer membrane beta-barrel protein [Bradyrhizobium sp.]
MRRLLLAAVMLGVLSSAHAADMPDFLRGSFTDGFSHTRVNWEGFYIGGQGGLGTSDMNFTGATRSVAAHLLVNTAVEAGGGVAEWPLGGKVSVHGNGFGGFAGYNEQWDDIVIGAELSYMHGKFGGTSTDSMSRVFGASGGYTDSVTYESTASMNISDMATARLRAGYSVGSFLPYVFGGVALGQADIIRTAHIFGNQVNANAAPGFTNIPFDLSATDAKNSHFIYGYSGGLGMDVMLMSCLFLRAEWEYVRFTSPIDTNVNTVRVGLGYKF